MPSPERSPHLMDRRTALKTLGAGALFSLGLWPGAGCATSRTPPRGKFTFIAVNDTHYVCDECHPWLEKAVALMRGEDPEFVLHIGDVCDDGLRAHHAAVRDIFATLGVGFYPVIGNHDWTTQTDRAAYEEIFPDRINYAFDHRGWHFVGLDSSDGQHWQGTLIADATFRWLDGHLANVDRDQPLVLFTHFPLIEHAANPAVEAKLSPMIPRNADQLLDRFRGHNLQAVFNGHFHAYTVGTFDSATATTNKCCSLKRGNFDGSKEKGFFVCTAEAGQITRRFVEVPMA